MTEKIVTKETTVTKIESKYLTEIIENQLPM